MKYPFLRAAGLFNLIVAAPQAFAATTGTCADLVNMKLPDTKVTSAEEVTGGSLTARCPAPLTELPPFCRVAAVTKPAVKFEVWLPLSNWNGQFQGVGNGANAGSIIYPAMATALKRGYATASTDTGHASEDPRDASWAVGHPELVKDFGYRSVHVTTQNAKKVVERFYQEPARHSYFVACSTGARPALMEAQRSYVGSLCAEP